MKIIIHVEATHLPQDHLPLTHPFQPHLLRFCGIVVDGLGNEVDRLCTLVRPVSPLLVSWDTTEYLSSLIERTKLEGQDPGEVLHWFTKHAGTAKHITIGNVLSDIEVIRIMRARLDRRKEGAKAWSSQTACLTRE